MKTGELQSACVIAIIRSTSRSSVSPKQQKKVSAAAFCSRAQGSLGSRVRADVAAWCCHVADVSSFSITWPSGHVTIAQVLCAKPQATGPFCDRQVALLLVGTHTHTGVRQSSRSLSGHPDFRKPRQSWYVLTLFSLGLLHAICHISVFVSSLCTACCPICRWRPPAVGAHSTVQACSSHQTDQNAAALLI